MKKYIYLFELDSVKKTDTEIEIGQKALYNEIVSNGNIVVLTYNQLVDSRGFFCLLNNQKYYNNLISLFENGSIRISQYGEIRTIAQYLINSLDYEKEFIYSGWPLKSTQKRLLALIRRSLIYSDLSEINGFVNGTRDNELKDLFIEVINNEIKESDLSMIQLKEIMKNLYSLLKTVLRLSSIHSIYIPPKDEQEYQNLKFHHILEHAFRLNSQTDNVLWEKAVKIIKNLPCRGTDNRSMYLHDLKDAFQRNNHTDKEAYQYAEAIINLCYNYACEISICNISKHYNIDELFSDLPDKPTFESDFFSRLEQDFSIGDLDSRFLLNETNEYTKISGSAAIPDLGRAVRITAYLKEHNKSHQKDVYRYEYEITRQKTKHKIHIISAIGGKTVLSFICIFIAGILELTFQFVQSQFDNIINFNTFLWVIAETFIFLFITEVITTVIAKKFTWLLPLSDALGGIGKLIADALHILFKKSDTYCNKCNYNTDIKEHCSHEVPIDYVKSDAMKRYLAIKRNKNYSYLFRQSDIYPLADTGDAAVLKNISRLEELFNSHFGIVYKSQYNIMCVDPIIKNGNCFSYERIIPAAGNGVVMVTLYNGKFVLLEQFRHALRKTQLSFPRGYGELNMSSEQIAKKELEEELNAIISSPPIFLGTLSPDSGLTSSFADVFVVEIDSYAIQADYEGIINVMELCDDEFQERLINSSKTEHSIIDDAFTISAYLLYKEYKKSL